MREDIPALRRMADRLTENWGERCFEDFEDVPGRPREYADPLGQRLSR